MSLRTGVTGDELLTLTGDYELVRGELVPMVPPGGGHGFIATNVAATVRAFVKQHDLGFVVMESGFYLERNPDTVRGPDAAFYAKGRASADQEGYYESAPNLAVEVVSPNDTSAEMEARVRDFLQAGVEEVWVVYPRTRTVHRFRIGWAQVLQQDDLLTEVPALPGFATPIREFFD